MSLTHLKWSDFPHSLARDTYVVGGKGWDGRGFMYISAPAFQVRLHVEGALLATAELTCAFYYYDWNQETWMRTKVVTASARGVDETDNKYYYHNWNGQNTDTEGQNFHLWRVEVVTISSGSQRYIEVDFSVGGCGCMSEEQYNAVCKQPYPKKLVVSAGRLGSDYLHWSDSQDDATALDYFRWSNDSGNFLQKSSMEKYIPKSWII